MIKETLKITAICIISLVLFACAGTSTRAEPVSIDHPAAYAPSTVQAEPKAPVVKAKQPEAVASKKTAETKQVVVAANTEVALSRDTANRKTGNPYVIKGVTYYPLDDVSEEYEEVGIASWYGKDFHGNKTANGEIYDMHSMSAAHKTLPMPTYVKVTNLDNNKSVVVRVNDRGPFSKGRIIDLSYSAAKSLDMVDAGTARVHVTVLSQSSDHLRTEGYDVDIDKGSFYVQIGAFTDVNNARNLAAKYKNAVVVPAVINGQNYYRVRVQGYTSKHAAAAAALSFEKEYNGAFVIAQ